MHNSRYPGDNLLQSSKGGLAAAGGDLLGVVTVQVEELGNTVVPVAD